MAGYAIKPAAVMGQPNRFQGAGLTRAASVRFGDADKPPTDLEKTDKPAEPAKKPGKEKVRTSVKKDRVVKTGLMASILGMAASALGALGLVGSAPPPDSYSMSSDSQRLETRLTEAQALKNSKVPEIQQKINENQLEYTRSALTDFFKDLTTVAPTQAETDAINSVMSRDVFQYSYSYYYYSSSYDSNGEKAAFEQAAQKLQALGITHLGEKPAAEKAILKELSEKLMQTKVSPEMVTRYQQLIDSYYAKLDANSQRTTWMVGLMGIFGISSAAALGSAVGGIKKKES